MFDSLTNKFENIFDKLKSSSRISDSDIASVSSEIREALIDADVNISVIDAFVEKISEQARGIVASPCFNDQINK
jgi:signal recognition particle subunit SRP54